MVRAVCASGQAGEIRRRFHENLNSVSHCTDQHHFYYYFFSLSAAFFPRFYR